MVGKRTFGVMSFNAGMLLDKQAKFHPEKPALLYEGRTLSYQELNDRSNRWANAFADLGLRKGDRVGILMMNCNEFVEAFFGLAKIGAVLVMLNPRLAPPELEYICKDCGTNCVVYGEEFIQTIEILRTKVGTEKFVCVGQSQLPSWAKDLSFIARHLPDEPALAADDEDPCIITYTSGTTGVPKGGVLTHNTVLSYCVTGS